MARRVLDKYETPAHYVDALVAVIGVPKGRVYEPCVGKGHIVKRLKHHGVREFDTNDLDEQYGETNLDATDGRSWAGLGDWCITNPPFAQELPILVNARRHCQQVAFVARLSFLEPTIDRAMFWAEHEVGLEVIVLPRYSFTGNGSSDSMTCCWLVWRDKPAAERVTFVGRDV